MGVGNTLIPYVGSRQALEVWSAVLRESFASQLLAPIPKQRREQIYQESAEEGVVAV